MNSKAQYNRDRATEWEIALHLALCDSDFVPPLSSRIDIKEYAHKIFTNATRFEAWAGAVLVGLVAMYCNDSSHRLAYITSVSVLPESQGNGIASQLMERCIAFVGDLGFESVELEVDSENSKAVHMYEKHGFLARRSGGACLVLGLDLGGRP